MKPRFSIVIPSYNRADLISETINSVLNQTYSDFEILVIDDGSTDNTENIIKADFSNYSKVKYFKRENQERGASRNFGINNSKGDYVVFLDSDDLFQPNHLHELNTRLEANSSINFIATKYNFLNNNKLEKSSIDELPEGEYNYTHFLKGNFLACNICVKRSNPQLKFFNEDRKYSSMEDWIFIIENLMNDKLILIDIITVTMREHEGRSMNANQQVIDKRILATDYLTKIISFETKELNTLRGYSYYFCAIHAYIDKNRKQGILLLIKAIKIAGLKKSFVALLAKLVIGKNILSRLK